MFIHQATELAFERNGQWVNQEKVYGFAVKEGQCRPIPAATIKQVYGLDLSSGEAKPVPAHLTFCEAVMV